MSTEHQQYSTNQADAIEKYAAQQNLTIVKRFVDSGKSGLTLSHRAALRDLLLEVQGGGAEFGVILVCDVSRWGRFQDADESAYYEYACKRAHVRVHYCAEQFENDESSFSALIKALKRTMTGEYRRELSVKVFTGQAQMVELGFRLGGPTGYGLRHQLVGSDGTIKQILKLGERKSIQSDRVRLTPGPRKECRIVRGIFHLFTVDRKSEREIAEMLNYRGVLSESGRPWSRCCVHQILINPKYVGSNVYNRLSTKLHKGVVRNPVDALIRRDAAFTAVVPIAHYAQAQKVMQARRRRLIDDEMLEHLKWLLKRTGMLSAKVINEDKTTPSACTYQKHFTSLSRAYSLIGYKPPWNYRKAPKRS
jgi:DNA invertase Pin-like site-specific DNA recombinase